MRHQVMLAAKAPTIIAASCGPRYITTTASTWVPTEYSYSSWLTTPAQAKIDVLAGAGPAYGTSPGPTYQAENATLTGGDIFESYNAGWNGSRLH